MNISINLFIIFCMAFLISCGSPERNIESDQSETAADEGTVEAATAADEDLQEDTDYLVSAHINSQLQVALGKMATQQSQSPQLQQFGEQLTVENKIIQHNINALATAEGIDIKPALTPEYVSLIDSIQIYNGREFDEAFLDLVIEEHNEDIDRFTSLATRMDNPITRDMITDNLEILQRRKNQAEELRESLE